MKSWLGLTIFAVVPLLLKADCPPNAVLGPDGSSCYVIIQASLDFNLSSMACQLNYGNFPLVHSARENAVLLGYLMSMGLRQGFAWLGYTAVNGIFVDPYGNPANYTNFFKTPSTLPGTVAVMSLDTGEWDTVRAVQEYPEGQAACVVQNPCQPSNSTLPPIRYSTTQSPYGTTRSPFGTTRSPFATTMSPIGTQCANNHRDGNPCPNSDWTFFSRTCACYKAISSTYFTMAEGVCRQNGFAHLASIHSPEEAVFVADLARNTEDGWQLKNNGQDNVIIGLQWDADHWSWTDGSAYDYELNWWKNQTEYYQYGQLTLTNPAGLYSLAQTYDCQNNVCRSAVCKHTPNW